MNGNYNPVLFTPKYTSTHQMKSQQPAHHFGGSQVQISGLGLVTPIRSNQAAETN